MLDMHKRKCMIEVLQTIKSDLDEDLKHLDGTLFNGRTVAVLFGKQAAAIDALANMIETILTEGM